MDSTVFLVSAAIILQKDFFPWDLAYAFDVPESFITAIHSGYSDGYHKAAIDITKRLVENLNKEKGDILQLLMNTPHESYIQMYTDAIYSNDEKTSETETKHSFEEGSDEQQLYKSSYEMGMALSASIILNTYKENLELIPEVISSVIGDVFYEDINFDFIESLYINSLTQSNDNMPLESRLDGLIPYFGTEVVERLKQQCNIKSDFMRIKELDLEDQQYIYEFINNFCDADDDEKEALCEKYIQGAKERSKAKNKHA